jgi:hypothetical protein
MTTCTGDVAHARTGVVCSEEKSVGKEKLVGQMDVCKACMGTLESLYTCHQ